MSLVVALVGTGLLGTAATAGAKVLPIASVDVATSNPTAGQPFDVVMRLGPGSDLPDAPWAKFEVLVLPADQTDPKGWPLDRNFWGTPVPLRRIGTGVYRGSAVVDRPGDYVVLARSSVIAHEGGFRNVGTAGDYAGPVKLRVGGVARSASATATRHADRSRSSAVVVWSAVTSFLAIALGTALWMKRTRSRRIAIASLPDA